MKKMSIKLLREFIDYDSESGAMIWRKRARKHFKSEHDWKSWNTRFSGKECGYINNDGYRIVEVNSVKYYGHRLAFTYYHGRWPKYEIDHIDQTPGHDWIENLRDTKENGKNRGKSSRNKSGFCGVSWDSGAKIWMAYVGKQYLGRFEDPELAGFVCELTRDKLGYHPNHGK